MCACIRFKLNSLGVCFGLDLAKLDHIWQSYHKYKKGKVCSET